MRQPQRKSDYIEQGQPDYEQDQIGVEIASRPLDAVPKPSRHARVRSQGTAHAGHPGTDCWPGATAGPKGPMTVPVLPLP